MELPEQYPPNKPNFGLIVILSGVAILVILIVGLWFVHHAAGRLPDGSRSTHTQVIFPAPPEQNAGYFAAVV